MKIFVSYSRIDAGDFANQIHRHLSSVKYDVFTDVNDINVGDIWSNTIEENISKSDIFVVIVTSASLLSPYVEREVLQAQKENKKIIPCFFRRIKPNRIKWGLEKIQGVEFDDKYELSRDLYSKIYIETDISSGKGTDIVIENASKTLKDVKNDATTPTKSTIDKPVQKNEDLQPIPKGRIGALGSGIPLVPSKIVDIEKTTKPDVDKVEQKKDISQPPQKVTKDDKVQSELSRNVSTVTPKKESTETKEKDIGKLKQGIFGLTSKTVEETKTNTPTTTFNKSNTEEISKKKDTLPSSNVNIGARGSSGKVPFTPQYSEPEYNNKEKEYTQTYNTSQSQGINLKLIIIPIIAVAIIGVIISISYFNTYNSHGYQFIKAWGNEGTGDGEFNFTSGISVDSEGYVYVADHWNHRIQKFDSNGKFITKWGSYGTGDGQFNATDGITVDSSTGNVYVADENNHRIQKFDSNGKFITKWGSYGSGDGQFNRPNGIAVDSSSGYVYVIDEMNDHIQKFDSKGNFIAKLESKGTENEQFIQANGIAVDSSGNLYVTNYFILRSGIDDYNIQKFDSNGNFIAKWGSVGTGNGHFLDANGIAIDSEDNVYVADKNNHRIQKFDKDGEFITKWGSEGELNGEFTNLIGIAISSSGYVYVTDPGAYFDYKTANQIQVFASTA